MSSGRWLPAAIGNALLEQKTDAFRIHAAPDAWVDRFGADLLVAAADERTLDTLARTAWDHPCAPAAPTVPDRRLFGKILVRQPGAADTPRQLQGPTRKPTTGVCREAGLRFETDCAAGYSPGLFCDQRNNRRHILRLRPRRVLNCFAYTCAFSVAAASTGAGTLSIDLSNRALAWGRRNFELNGLASNDHRFFADDVMSALPRLARRGERFDAIILDPPTFSRSGKKKTFRVERDMETLITMALACASDDAWILLSTNQSQFTPTHLEHMARSALRDSGRGGVFHREPVPEDFQNSPAAATVWLRLG